MSSNFQCDFCKRYFSSRNGLSQHINRCISTYLSTEESSDVASNINEMSLDRRYFEQIKELQIIREEENLSDTDCMQENLPENFELGPEPESIRSFRSYEPEPESIRSYEPEPGSIRSYEPEPGSIRSFQNYESEFESIRSYEEPEVEDIKEFPNETYADLMKLVVENNLSNTVGNAIINFFNKHSNLSQSPLPKNITAGRKFMNKMNISHLSYYQHKILVHNHQEYFIHYRPITNCVQNLLSNPEISRHLAYDYKNLEVNLI
jgi:hypothetical protein